MAARAKNSGFIDSAKTVIKQKIKVEKLKSKIKDRKATNVKLRRAKKGGALTAKDSRALAEATAKKKM